MGVESSNVNNKNITIGTTIIHLPGSVRLTLEIEGLTVTLVSNADFEPDLPQEYNRNVFAFDQNGQFIWRIDPVPWGGDRPKSYSNIYKYDEETLIAYSGLGYEMRVELGTGRVELWQVPGTPPGQRPW